MPDPSASGSPHIYYSAYGEAALQVLADEVRAATPAGLAPWIIFDNAAHGHASADAAPLQALLGASLS